MARFLVLLFLITTISACSDETPSTTATNSKAPGAAPNVDQPVKEQVKDTPKPPVSVPDVKANEDEPDKSSWTPGLRHPEKKLSAAKTEGDWVPAPGYVWLDSDDENAPSDTVIRSPGMIHNKHARIEAGEKEGEWIPKSGYVWNSQDERTGFLKALELNEAEGIDAPVRWQSGLRHRRKKLMSHTVKEEWVPAPGYVWADEDDEEAVIWQPGMRHVTRKDLIAGSKEGQWEHAPGYRGTE